MKYIHNETGHPVEVIKKDIVNSEKGKKQVLIKTSAGRSMLKPQKKFLKDFSEESLQVFINLNNKLNGEDIYAVIAMDAQDVWLASCKTKEEAELFIDKNKFDRIRFIDTRSGG